FFDRAAEPDVAPAEPDDEPGAVVARPGAREVRWRVRADPASRQPVPRSRQSACPLPAAQGRADRGIPPPAVRVLFGSDAAGGHRRRPDLAPRVGTRGGP